MNLRPARVQDADRLWFITKTALGYDAPLEVVRARTEALTEGPSHLLLCAVDETDQPIGYLHACAFDTIFYKPLKYVTALAVDPAHRHEGLGRALLEACEDWARAEGCAGVRLSSGVNRANAHEFYAHMGYVVRKEQKSIWKLFDDGAPWMI